MKLKIKIAAATLGIGLLAVGSGMVTAATYYGYDTRVPAVSDYESSNKTKISSGSAYNVVNYVEGNRGIVSWIENTGGSNVTPKVSYTTTGTKTMTYYYPSSNYVGKLVHLNISTAVGNYTATGTRGSWTPN
ncbi:hypothetical protein [Edaphobacillus lindanitolerans]|uniref:Uncharacterized protein n=1 Tax=Edaphobacillus lindanitolerans TaxID=550447 RepID=A0A1U7PPC3_9BACI|nr:hypothetical protein [Edaphobacillus lindanitolerans]SIT79753.1 hypothetical protein SAMN05428946_1255 [Edaphobacillus lindanitolerans]